MKRAAQLVELHSLLLGHSQVHAEQDGRRRVDRHRGGDLTQRDPLEERLHIGQRVDGNAAMADLAAAGGCVRVLAHQSRHVEGDRQAGLAVFQKVVIAPVRLRG